MSHKGQQRASGEPYLSHPLEVAGLLVDFKMDVTTVTAGLLHDVLEDTRATKDDLAREFGPEIAELVDGVTKIGKLAFSSREERQAENFRKMVVAMAHDLRVLMTKLADRPKHFYSIWKKMHEGGREFDEIYDLTAVRVLTKTVRDCYGALGVIHSLWKPVPGRFKDFIAMPKVNMYQSLHTTVIGPKGDPVEIQIRTVDMHRVAEEGIAAHWLYKEKKSGHDRFDEAFMWLRQLMESQTDVTDSKEFLDSVRVDLFPDEVY